MRTRQKPLLRAKAVYAQLRTRPASYPTSGYHVCIVPRKWRAQ